MYIVCHLHCEIKPQKKPQTFQLHWRLTTRYYLKNKLFWTQRFQNDKTSSPQQRRTYLSVNQGNADHVIVKQHAALPPESIQLLFRDTQVSLLQSLFSFFSVHTSAFIHISKANGAPCQKWPVRWCVCVLCKCVIVRTGVRILTNGGRTFLWSEDSLAAPHLSSHLSHYVQGEGFRLEAWTDVRSRLGSGILCSG